MSRKVWMAIAGAALVLALTAGAGGYYLAGAGRQAATNPTPSAAPSLVASASPSLEPSPLGSASPIPVPLTCRIAVSGYSQGSGGFVDLTDGSYTVDKGSNVSIEPGQRQRIRGRQRRRLYVPGGLWQMGAGDARLDRAGRRVVRVYQVRLPEPGPLHRAHQGRPKP